MNHYNHIERQRFQLSSRHHLGNLVAILVPSVWVS